MIDLKVLSSNPSLKLLNLKRVRSEAELDNYVLLWPMVNPDESENSCSRVEPSLELSKWPDSSLSFRLGQSWTLDT